MSRNGGFSLIELIVVIAVIAIISSFAITSYLGMTQASKNASDSQNVGLWNTSYSYVVAAEPSFASLDWSNASSQLAAGIEIRLNSSNAITMRAAVPKFSKSGEPDFEPGKGITSAPDGD